MNKYIFLTDEGYTYLPNSVSTEPDCENSQVLGIVEADSEDNAYKKLLKENVYLLNKQFSQIYCYKIEKNFEKKYFYIED